jgi:hypothetical protein
MFIITGYNDGHQDLENGMSEVTIRDPSIGRIITNQDSTDEWVQRQVSKGPMAQA